MLTSGSGLDQGKAMGIAVAKRDMVSKSGLNQGHTMAWGGLYSRENDEREQGIIRHVSPDRRQHRQRREKR